MLIKHAYVVFEENIQVCDVRIEKGKIVEIGTNLRGDGIDAKGQYLLPALVDLGIKAKNAKLRNETLSHLSQEGAQNGFGTIALCPWHQPPIDNEITLEFVKSQTRQNGGALIVPLVAGIQEDGRLSDCSIMIKEGGAGIVFESDIDGNRIRRLMEYAKMHNTTLFCRANDRSLQANGVMHEGALATDMGLGGIHPIAESSQVARIAEMAQAFEVKVVFLGASTPRTITWCESAPYLYAQISLHHLLLSDQACKHYDTRGKLFPPLRDQAMRSALLQKIATSKQVMLSSLHAPVSASAKDAVFAEAAYGINGLKDFLPLLYTYLVKEGVLQMTDVGRMCAQLGAEAIGLPQRGSIALNNEASLILFDPTPKRRIDDPTSPYHGWPVEGSIEKLHFKENAWY